MTELLLACLATLLLTPLVIHLMQHRGIVDVPNSRSSHIAPVPRGGGLACLVGAFFALTVGCLQDRSSAPTTALLIVAALTLVGFIDDARQLPIGTRLVAQATAGALVGLALGGGWWICIGAIVAVCVVNVVNFMDGINGIASLSLAWWGVTAFAIGQSHHVPQLAAVGAVTAGVSIGFLPWNAPKARIFLGDAGSYLLGGLATTGILLGWSTGAPMPLLISPLYLFFLDTSSVLIKRVLRGASLFQAHREHTYQRLTSARASTHMITSLLVTLSSVLITVSWTSRALWVPVTTTTIASAAYLLAPRLLASRIDESSSPITREPS